MGTTVRQGRHYGASDLYRCGRTIGQLAPVPYLRMFFKGIQLLGCFPRGDSWFYLVLELVSSFSSSSYPSVRKYTDNFGINMSINMVLNTRRRCYSFDQSVRKRNYRLVVSMKTINIITFPDTVVLLLLVYIVLLLWETSCPPQPLE